MPWRDIRKWRKPRTYFGGFLFDDGFKKAKPTAKDKIHFLKTSKSKVLGIKRTKFHNVQTYANKYFNEVGTIQLGPMFYYSFNTLTATTTTRHDTIDKTKHYIILSSSAHGARQGYSFLNEIVIWAWFTRGMVIAIKQ